MYHICVCVCECVCVILTMNVGTWRVYTRRFAKESKIKGKMGLKVVLTGPACLGLTTCYLIKGQCAVSQRIS